MNKQQIINTLKTMNYQNGSYIKIAYEKNVTTKAGEKMGHKVTKYTIMTVRLGINYSHTKFAQARAAQQVQTPSAREIWYKHTECKYIVEHKTNGKEYLQAFSSPNKATSWYEIDGIRLDKNEYAEYVGMGIALKQSPHNEEMCVMTIPVENIKEFGNYIEF
jgi:hypothetical protein